MSIAMAIVLFVTIGCLYYRTPPTTMMLLLGRLTLTPIVSELYQGDLKAVGEIVEEYYHGDRVGCAPRESWDELAAKNPQFEVMKSSHQGRRYLVPYVYQSPESPHLVDVRTKYHIDQIIAAGATEFERMLLLVSWIGTRWDHGEDKPIDCERHLDPVKVLSAAENGAKYG